MKKSAVQKSYFQKFALTLLAVFGVSMIAQSASSLACSCAGPFPIDPNKVVSDFLAKNYSIKEENIRWDKAIERGSFFDRLLYIAEGSPEPTGGNCWEKNEYKEPIHQCASKYFVEYQVSYDRDGKVCKQSFDVTTTVKNSKIKYTVPTCK